MQTFIDLCQSGAILALLFTVMLNSRR